MDETVYQRRQYLRTAGPDGMPQRNGSSVYVEPLHLKWHFAMTGYHLGRKSFVEFDQIHPSYAHSGLVKRLLHRIHGRDRELLRVCRRNGIA